MGVSGGADSVFLLHALYALRDKRHLALTVVHLNHMLRGQKSEREAEFVRQLARQLYLPCVIEQRNVGDLKKTEGLSLQEAAREVRYGFFQEVLKRMDAQKIALGHHADDQAETVLMWLLRGTALKGLSGMHPFRDNQYIRPLIEITREEIEAYLHDHMIAYVPDVSRQELHYLRNKIRHQLIPLIKKEYNPQIVSALNRTADLARLDNAVLDCEIKGILKQCIREEDNRVYCSISEIKKHDQALYGRLVRGIIVALKGDMRAVHFRHINAVCGLLEAQGSSKQVQLPGGWCVWREYDRLVFSGSQSGAEPFCYTFDKLPDSVRIREIGKTIFFQVCNANTAHGSFAGKEKNVEFLDNNQVQFPLVVRNWLPGDRFYPLGLHGSKKLKDFFTDSKVPVRARHNIPVVSFHNKIAWVCGLRIDERFKVTSDSKKVLKMWIE